MFQNKPQNYLSMIPVQNVQEFSDTEGGITLLIPKFKNEKLRKWLIPKHKSPYFRIHFDETGSQIWRLINGVRSVEELCLEVSCIFQRDGKSVDRIEERITQFLTSLYKKRYIFLINKTDN